MHNEVHFKKVGPARKFLAAATMAGFMVFMGAPMARADQSECQHRIERADHKLHEAGERHGWQSRQAEHARQELREARERCWNTNHRWWDADGHRWRTDRDWDDHDHDHGDHDH